MDSTLHFYTNPMSRGRIIQWMLEETGAKYETHLLDFQKAEHKAPDYLKLNPMGKLPTIVHKGVVVTECAAICTYLADAFPEAKLAPPVTSPERGTYYRWLFFGASCIEAATMDKMFPRTGEAKPSYLGYGNYNDTINTIQSALKPGPYILGSQFSAADVYIASQIGWGIVMKSIEPNPVFSSYVKACQDRPAYQRANQISEELIAKMKK